MNLWVYRLEVTSITAALTVFFVAAAVVVSKTPEGFGCCICGRKAPEKAKLDFVISRLLGRRRIMKQLARIKYSLV